MDRLQAVPSSRHHPRSLSVGKHRSMKRRQMHNPSCAHGQALQNEVRDIKVGGFGETLRQEILNRQRVLDYFRERGRYGRCEGRNKEDLDDLEDEI